MAGKGERAAIGSLYHRIQEVKSGAVMPQTSYTYSTGDMLQIDPHFLSLLFLLSSCHVIIM